MKFLKLKLLATSLALVGVIGFASTTEAKVKMSASPETPATAVTDTSPALEALATAVPEELVVITTAAKNAIAAKKMAARTLSAPKLSVLVASDFTINATANLRSDAMTSEPARAPKLEVASPLMSGLLLAKNAVRTLS